MRQLQTLRCFIRLVDSNEATDVLQTMDSRHFSGFQRAQLEAAGIGGVGEAMNRAVLSQTVRATRNLTRCCWDVVAAMEQSTCIRNALRRRASTLIQDSDLLYERARMSAARRRR